MTSLDPAAIMVEHKQSTGVVPEHQPTYCTARGRGWASCCCGWLTDTTKSGNLMWAQLEFGKHLVQASTRRGRIDRPAIEETA